VKLFCNYFVIIIVIIITKHRYFAGTLYIRFITLACEGDI